MRRRLSSWWTYFYKRIFPIAWITGFGMGTVYLWVGTFKGQSSPELKWIALLSLLAGSAFLLWFSSRLKDVWLYGNDIIVSDYRSEEWIPLWQIEEVTETRLWNPKLIKLRLAHSGKWGDQIVFVAPIRFRFVFLNHPLVEELRGIILQARAGGHEYVLPDDRAWESKETR